MGELGDTWPRPPGRGSRRSPSTPSSASRSTSDAGKNFVTTTRAGLVGAAGRRHRAGASGRGRRRAGPRAPRAGMPSRPPRSRRAPGDDTGEAAGRSVTTVRVQVVPLPRAARDPAHRRTPASRSWATTPAATSTAGVPRPRHRGAHRLHRGGERPASPAAPRSTGRTPTARRPRRWSPAPRSRIASTARCTTPATSPGRPGVHGGDDTAGAREAAPARSRRRGRPGPARAERVTRASQLGGSSGTPSTTATSAPWHWSMYTTGTPRSLAQQAAVLGHGIRGVADVGAEVEAGVAAGADAGGAVGDGPDDAGSVLMPGEHSPTVDAPRGDRPSDRSAPGCACGRACRSRTT